MDFTKVTCRSTYHNDQIIVYSSLTVLKGVFIREVRLLQNTFPRGGGGGGGESVVQVTLVGTH